MESTQTPTKQPKLKLDFKDSKYATGRRKTSIAKVWLKKGSGKIYVNNFGKIYQTILSLFDLMFLYLKDVESHQRIKEHEIIREEISLDERI